MQGGETRLWVLLGCAALLWFGLVVPLTALFESRRQSKGRREIKPGAPSE